jgi:hypothetical protein
MKKLKNNFVDPFDEVLLAATKDPMKRYHFYKAFLELELVVLGNVTTDKGDPVLHLKYIEVNNEIVLPVYSSWQKFDSIFQSNYTYVKIKTRELLQSVESNTAWVLNPGFDISKKIIPEELETLRDGRIFHYFFNQLSPALKEQLLAEQIVEIPKKVVESISECLRTYPSINRAYLTNIYNPMTGERPFSLIGLEVDEQVNETSAGLLAKIFQSVKQIAPARIELAILDQSLPLTQSIVSHIAPFYDRTSVDDLHSMFH